MVYAITKDFPDAEKYGLVSQMRRAAVSIPANVAEGYKRHGLQDKIRFYKVMDPKVRMYCNAPKKIANEGDILISVRAPVGPTNINSQKSCIGRGLAAIRAENDSDTKYLRNRSVLPPEGGKNPKKWCPQGVYTPCGHHFFG